ncbi:MAG: GGDEF domain-containing protein [Hymenobacter sp.]
MLLALLAGGLQNMQVRYRTELEKIELRRAISGLARLDPLTGLQNRLGLCERFDEIAAGDDADGTLALHCLDLDQFKPVNDRYGHLAGDELLRLVSRRLDSSIRQGDCAARIGGDEFVILQRGMRHPDDADHFARRLYAALGEAYQIGAHSVIVGVSIGYVIPDARSRSTNCSRRPTMRSTPSRRSGAALPATAKAKCTRPPLDLEWVIGHQYVAGSAAIEAIGYS